MKLLVNVAAVNLKVIVVAAAIICVSAFQSRLVNGVVSSMNPCIR